MIQIRFSDGYEGFARFWVPEQPRGAVLYLHGIQSHGQWFLSSAERLVSAGLAVMLPDRRGSGRNDQDRGHTPSARRLLQDGADWLDDLRIRTGFDQSHIIGVSWGGKLALGLLSQYLERIASLALVAPGLFPRVDLPVRQKVKVGLSVLTSKHALFNIPLNDPALFTTNPERQRFIEGDPLKLQQVTASFLLASRKFDHVIARLPHTKEGRPLRIFLAGQDRIIDNERTRRFVRDLTWPTREITEYPEAHHTLEFEADPEPYLSDLVEWVTRQNSEQA